MMIVWRNGKRIMIDSDGNETIIGSVKIKKGKSWEGSFEVKFK